MSVVRRSRGAKRAKNAVGHGGGPGGGRGVLALPCRGVGHARVTQIPGARGRVATLRKYIKWLLPYPTVPYRTLPGLTLPYPTLPYPEGEGRGGLRRCKASRPRGGVGEETGTWRGRGPKGKSPASAVRWATMARWGRRGRLAAPDQPSPPPQPPSLPPNGQAQGRSSAGACRRTVIHVFLPA